MTIFGRIYLLLPWMIVPISQHPMCLLSIFTYDTDYFFQGSSYLSQIPSLSSVSIQKHTAMLYNSNLCLSLFKALGDQEIPENAPDPYQIYFHSDRCLTSEHICCDNYQQSSKIDAIISSDEDDILEKKSSVIHLRRELKENGSMCFYTFLVIHMTCIYTFCPYLAGQMNVILSGTCPALLLSNANVKKGYR